MLKLMIGVKGTGKTKTLIEKVNEAAGTSHGDVVCIEKGTKLRFDIKPTVRLIDAGPPERLHVGSVAQRLLHLRRRGRRQLAVGVRRARAEDGIRRHKGVAHAALPLAGTSRTTTAIRHALLYLVADKSAEDGAPRAAAAKNAAEDAANRYPLKPHVKTPFSRRTPCRERAPPRRGRTCGWQS